MEIEDFIKAGFSQHPAGLESKWASCLLQKRIFDDHGNTKYFINVYPSTVLGHLTFTACVRFYRKMDSFDLTMNPESRHDPEYIQKTIADFWASNGMDIDPHN